MKPREPFWGVVWPLGWAALTAAPYLAAWLATPPGHRYLWLLPPYAVDSQAYLAWARQSYLGAYLFKLKFTAIAHEPFLIQPFFFAVGRVASWGGWELGVVQLAFKCLGVVLFWTAFRRLARRLGFSGTALWAASILAGFGAGLGGALLLLIGVEPIKGHMPMDIWFIDSNTLWALTWNALFPYSLALIVFYVEALDRASCDERGPWPWLAGLMLALLLLVHPYAAPLLALMAALTAAARRRPGALWKIALVAAPAALYVYWTSVANPLVARHGELGRMETPSWLAVTLGLAPVMTLAVWGAVLGGRDFARRHALLICWALSALLLSRAPFWFQRKLLFGAQLPLSLLAGAAVAAIAERDGGGRRTAVGLVVIALSLGLPSLGYIAYNSRLSLSLRENGRYYAPAPVMEALEFLSRQGTADEVVLCRPDMGGLVAMTAGKAAVWGHWAQSVDSRETQRWFDDLLSSRDPAARAASLWKKVDYVFVDGPLKREVDEGRLRWLKASGRRLFENSDAAVYAGPRLRAP